jgi:hypothetical protein
MSVRFTFIIRMAIKKSKYLERGLNKSIKFFGIETLLATIRHLALCDSGNYIGCIYSTPSYTGSASE